MDCSFKEGLPPESVILGIRNRGMAQEKHIGMHGWKIGRGRMKWAAMAAGILVPGAALAASDGRAAGDVQVSAYYYPWYAGAEWNPSDFLRGKNRMDIPPLIGTYDNATGKVAVRQHIEWGTNFGIDNWIASWWGPGAYQSNAILKNLMPNLAGTNMTFCLFYETTAFYEGKWTFGAAEVQLFYDHIKHMNDNYFTNPNYWRVDGKPVVMVYLSREMNGAYAEALARVRKDFNVFLIGDDFHFGPPDPDRHKNWDAITIYNVHGISAFDGYPKATGLVEGVRSNFRKHKQAIAANGTRFMANAIPGYNDRAVRLAAGHYPIPRKMAADSAEGSTFNQMLGMSLEEGDADLGTAICSWNEWWEDSQIEPTVVSPPTDKDGTAEMTYSKGYKYEGYGAALLKMVLARAGRNASVAPALNIQEPGPRNAWARGAAQTLAWTHAGIIHYVNLEYWNGSAWTRIATQAENTGSFKWTVAADAALPVQVRVTTVEGVTVGLAGGTMVRDAHGTFARNLAIRSGGGSVSFGHLGGIREIAVLDAAGRSLASLKVRGSERDWDGRSAAGSPVPAGAYRALFTGPGVAIVKPFALLR
jgi:glycoprotein endo-alpha-1,2-mannosidase